MFLTSENSDMGNGFFKNSKMFPEKIHKKTGNCFESFEIYYETRPEVWIISLNKSNTAIHFKTSRFFKKKNLHSLAAGGQPPPP